MATATSDAALAARFIQRAKFAATPDDIADYLSIGPDRWLDRHFAAAPGQSGAEWLTANGHAAVTSEARYFWPQAGDHMIWNQLIAQPDEMRQRLAFALSQFFVVSLNPIDGYWPPYMMAGYWSVLTRHAFGNFRDLMQAVTLNAAMGMYLNTKGNLKEDPATGRQPDENYAREIMQLFTIGLYELNPDGTERLDAAGKPIETYTQSDVTNLARVFTGYDHDMRRVKRTDVAWQDYPVISQEFCLDPMVLDSAKHSTLAVTFLGLTIPEGTPGETALTMAHDHLFNHPNVGPFFGRQMIQRLVTSNPTPAYVGRVAAAFADNGKGLRGDLKAVWRAVLTDPEAMAPPRPDDRLSGKVREPVLRYVGWARTVGLKQVDEPFEMFDTSRNDEALAQSPLRSPSVFNFFRSGYRPPQTEIARADKLAPEFQIANETSIAGYLNFLQWTIRWGTRGIRPSYAALLPMAHDARAVTEWLNLHLAAGRLSDASVTLIADALADTPLTIDAPEERKLDRLASACLLVMASPEYLVEK
ncbi:DUF1800 domain-containing protein [Sphingomonas sp. FW199]|uniref:DUF1800 domain-containing protein n=1 Tax=Sphingomonas sp. FW199 TaxID=3400217 RepID=UPI003CE96514